MGGDYPSPAPAPHGWPGLEPEDEGTRKDYGAKEPLGLTAREKLYGQRRLRDDHYGSRCERTAESPVARR